MPRPALVSCRSCSRHWHSPISLDGLRVLGHCPMCRGELAFHTTSVEVTPEPPTGPAPDTDPHLVLGAPRLEA